MLNLLKKINNFTGKYFALLIIIISAGALYTPNTFKPIVPHIPVLLGVIMFGMGMTLKGEDFKLILKNPKPVLIGATAQFTIMPLIAFVLCYIFKLPPDFAAGVILVGTCPGGTASNVIAYLAKGDVALSVSMTTVTTMLAPILTPILTLLLAGKFIPVSAYAMFLSIVKVILLPILLSIIIKNIFKGKIEAISEILPLLSIVCIMLINAGIVGANSSKIISCALILFVITMLHNTLGLCSGYFIAKFFGLSEEKRRTLSFEVGVQNAGLGVSLATSHFTPMAALPAAVAVVWHLIAAPILAGFWSKRPIKPSNNINKNLEVKNAV
ncbi:bile acid:sodium symporter family protein [Clostridium oceanicum]|uniref:Bile acid:sodium symporter family protein n=1 Tax=Clostridium oceanicum TaxID=1543 RepID=A0ABN1JJ67_9CLOT